MKKIKIEIVEKIKKYIERYERQLERKKIDE